MKYTMLFFYNFASLIILRAICFAKTLFLLRHRFPFTSRKSRHFLEVDVFPLVDIFVENPFQRGYHFSPIFVSTIGSISSFYIRRSREIWDFSIQV